MMRIVERDLRRLYPRKSAASARALSAAKGWVTAL